VATEDPIINILRVQRRVSLGGHPVPEDKIAAPARRGTRREKGDKTIALYSRSLDLLVDAIRHTNRAYIFDNSTHQQINIVNAPITQTNPRTRYSLIALFLSSLARFFSL
jgi:predicted ABC-type ATPase